MSSGSVPKYAGLVLAAVATIMAFVMADKNSSEARELTVSYAWLVAAGLFVSAVGEISLQLKRRSDVAAEANRIAERRANLDGARLAKESEK